MFTLNITFYRFVQICAMINLCNILTKGIYTFSNFFFRETSWILIWCVFREVVCQNPKYECTFFLRNKTMSTSNVQFQLKKVCNFLVILIAFAFTSFWPTRVTVISRNGRQNILSSSNEDKMKNCSSIVVWNV